MPHSPRIDDRTWMALNGFTHLTYIQAADDRASLYRFQISGSYPRKEGNCDYISSYDNPPEIGMTSSRPPKTLVKDIKRCFRPNFHHFNEVAPGCKRQHEEYEARRNEAVTMSGVISAVSSTMATGAT